MKQILHQLIHGKTLSAAEAQNLFEEVMQGHIAPEQVASLLTILAMRQPTVDELAGAATVMRRHAIAIDAPLDAIDVCGTGGTSSPFFNISTAAAIVAAAAGAPVVKHGNRSVTSRSGSSDVLHELGVNIHANVEQEQACLQAAGICFAFAPKHHPAMRHVAAIRTALGFSTIFNLLGPLTNPGGARRQLVGTGSPELAEKILRVLVQLGALRAMVVCGQDAQRGPICEIAITGETDAIMFDRESGEQLRHTLRPADLGLREFPDSADLVISSAAESADKIREIFTGKPGAPREIVLANAGAALWVAGRAETVQAGVEMGRQAVDSGAATDALDALRRASGSA